MRKSLVVALSGLLLATAAHADLVIDNGGKKVVAHPVMSGQPSHPTTVAQELPVEHVVGHVTQVGKPIPSEASATVQGWADQVVLKDALRQILPSGFSVIPEEQLSLNRQVSWEGGQSWITILDHMTRLYNFNVLIDWNRHQIRVSPLAPPQSHALAVAQRTTGLAPIASDSMQSHPMSTCIQGCPVHSGVVSGSMSTSKVAFNHSAPVVLAPVEKTWVLDPTHDLKQNVQAWGKQAGWVVRWDAVNYKVAAKVVLHGEFAAPDGPLATLIKAYEKADQPLTAHLTTMDHVVNITNKNYQPSEVVALGQDADVSNMMNANRSPATPDNSTYRSSSSSFKH